LVSRRRLREPAKEGLPPYLAGRRLANRGSGLARSSTRSVAGSRGLVVPNFAASDGEDSGRLPLEERRGNFREVELGYNETEARVEACRCLKCDWNE